MEPTPEQVSAWIGSVLDRANDGEDLLNEHGVFLAMRVARLAYAAGADAELEACCKWVQTAALGAPHWASDLLHARRPKPPSLKQQALEAFELLLHDERSGVDVGPIRRALESLPDDPEFQQVFQGAIDDL